MFAHEFDECRRVRLPIHWKALKIFEDGVKTRFAEKSNRVFSVFVKVGVEYSLVHKVRIAADVEENPSQVVKSKRGEKESDRLQ